MPTLHHLHHHLHLHHPHTTHHTPRTNNDAYTIFDVRRSFNDSHVTVDPRLVPTNFDRSGVFQIVSVEVGAKIGTAVRYGSSVAFQHRFTQKYVTCSRNGELTLSAARHGAPPGTQCWFRPMPRIKLFAEGQVVTVNARVLIESFSTPAASKSWLSILTSSREPNDTVADNRSEVSGSKASTRADNDASNAILAVATTRETGIQLRMFASHAVGSRGHLLKGGDFVRLFHQEHAALLEVQSIHNHRHNHHGFDENDLEHTVVLCPISEAVVNGDDEHGVSSIWQVELGETNRGGRALHWEDSIRLKNVLSDGYLDFEAVNMDGSAGISLDRSRSSAITLAAPQNARIGLDDTVPSTAPFYIKGTEGRWLHISNVQKTQQQQQQQTGEANVHRCPSSHHHHLTHANVDAFQVSFVGTKRDEDAFNVQPVELADIQDLFIAKAHQTTLIHMLNRLAIWDLSGATEEFSRYVHAIDSLFDFCCTQTHGEDAVGDPAAPTSSTFKSASWATAPQGGFTTHQKLLVDLDVPAILIDFTSQAFEDRECTAWATFEDELQPKAEGEMAARPTWDVHLACGRLQAFDILAKKSFRLLKQLVVGNALAGYAIFNRFKVPITNQCRLLGKIASIEWNVAAFLEEAFSNNLLLMSEIDTEYVRALAKVIEDAHSLIDLEQYCLLLSSVCVHDGNAIVDVQDAIRDQIIELLPQARLDTESGDVMLVYRNPKADRPYKDWDEQLLKLHSIFPAVSRRSAQDQQHLAFFSAVLKLLSQICVGRRKSSRDLVIKHIAGFDITMAVLRDERVNPTIRSGFAQLCRKLFVDADPLGDDLLLDRDWEDVTNLNFYTRTDVSIAGLVPSTPGWNSQLITWLEIFLVESSLKLDAFQVYIGWKHSGGNQLSAAQVRMEDEMAGNTLLMSVLELCADMLRNRFFTKGEQRRNLEHFLLDLLKDMQSSSLRHNERSPAHGVVCDALRLVCDNLAQLLTLRSRSCLEELLLAFKKVYAEQQLVIAAANEKSKTVLGSFKKKKTSVIKMSAVAAADEMVGVALSDILQETPLQPQGTQSRNTTKSTSDEWYAGRGGLDTKSFVKRIFDLLHYNDDRLRTSALGLLFASFSVRETAVGMLSGVTIAVNSFETDFLRDIYKKKALIKVAEHADLTGSRAELLQVVADLNALLLKSENNTAAIKKHQDTMRHVNIYSVVVEFISEHLLIRDAENMEKKLQKSGIRYLFAQCFQFLSLFVADNVANQIVLLTPTVWNIIMCACRHNVGAETTLTHLLQQPDAMACMQIHNEDIRTLANYVLDFEHCRTPAYLRMLCYLIGPKAGTNATERQSLLFEALFHTNAIESLFPVEKRTRNSSQSTSPTTSEETRKENRDDDIFIRMSQRMEREAGLRGKTDSTLSYSSSSQTCLVFVEFVTLYTVCILNNTATTKLMQEKIRPDAAVQILLDKTFKRFPMQLKDVLIRFVHLLYLEPDSLSEHASPASAEETFATDDRWSRNGESQRENNGGMNQTTLLSRTQIVLQSEVEACIQLLGDATIEGCNRGQSGKTNQSVSSDAFVAVDIADIRSQSATTSTSQTSLLFGEQSISSLDSFAISTLSSACNSLLERAFTVLTEQTQGAGTDTQYLQQHTMSLATTLSKYFKCRSLARDECNLSFKMQEEGANELWRLLDMVRTYGDHRLDEVHRSMTLLEKTCEAWEEQAHVWRSRAVDQRDDDVEISGEPFGSDTSPTPVEHESKKIARALQQFVKQARCTISQNVGELFEGAKLEVEGAIGTTRLQSPGFWLLAREIKELLGREYGKKKIDHPLSPPVKPLLSASSKSTRNEPLQKRQLMSGGTNAVFLWRNNKVGPNDGPASASAPTDLSMGLRYVFRQYQHPQEQPEFAAAPKEVICDLLYLIIGVLALPNSKQITQKLCNAGLTTFVLCQMTLDARLAGLAARLSSRVLAITNLQFQAKFCRILTRSRHTMRVLLHIRDQCEATKRRMDHFGSRSGTSPSLFAADESSAINLNGRGGGGRASPSTVSVATNLDSGVANALLGSMPMRGTQSESLFPALKFVADLCSGCYRPSQDVLRDQQSLSTINLLSVLCECVASCSTSSRFKLLHGHGIAAATDKSFPTVVLTQMKQEMYDTSVAEGLLRTIVAMVQGPNRESQEVLDAHNVPDAIVSLLSLMGPQGNHANSLSTFVLFVQDGLEKWMEEYNVTFETMGSNSDDGSMVQQRSSGSGARAQPHLCLLQAELDDAAQLRKQLVIFSFSIRKCEDALLTTLVAFLEGRHSSDPAYDSVTKALFENVSLTYYDKSLLFKGLTVHWVESEGPDAARDAAIGYYIVLSQLATGSKLYGPTIQRLLTQWDKTSALKDHIGRFELVRGGVLSPVYFPLPDVVAHSRGSETLQRIKEDVLCNTHLLDDTERVQQFLQSADLIIAITRQQAYYSRHAILKWLLHERVISLCALSVTMGLNGMYIASVEPNNIGWSVLGVIHVILSVLMVAVYLLNHTTVDNSRSKECSTSSSSGLEAILRLVVFWIFETRMLFQLTYLIFSVLGLVVSHSYFVFALLDIVSMFGGMQIIQNAMFASATKLIAMLGLAVVVLYALAVVGQNQFHGAYSFPDSGMISCEVGNKFSDCFRDHLYTFGERAVFDDVIPNGAAFIYAVFYNVVVVFLLSGIFVGIITDSFGQLRQEEAELRKARESYCYCCSHSRSELEEGSPLGFKGHVLHEHNVWCVVWFLIHVLDKSEAAELPLSGSEQYFLNAHRENRVAKLWPFKRALSIDGTTNVAKGLDQVISMLGGLIAQSNSTADNLEELGGSISALSRLTHLRVAALLHAAADGNIMEMEMLISQTNVDPNSSDYDGRVALHIAAAEGQEAAVRFLLAQGARPDVRDRWGQTPIQSAKKFPGVSYILEEAIQHHAK